MFTDLAKMCCTADTSVREAMLQMDAAGLGIVLVVDDGGHLLGTVTDGDIRRAILSHVDLEHPTSLLLARKSGTRFTKPITAQAGGDRNEYLRVLRQHNILHLPILDADQRVVGLATMDSLAPDQPLPLQAVVMAGGTGSRLAPLTEALPKPMLRVGDRPLLEIIIKQLRDAGIRQVKVTTCHQSEKITEHFSDGRTFGVELSYVEEDRPLGTVGGLSLMDTPKETTLVMNGDILTQVDFRTMLAYHREHQADLTVAVRRYDIKVPYGVIECDGPVVRSLSEKPTKGFLVNAGIYLLEPIVYQFLQNGERCDMTDLIQRLLQAERSVVSFPVREYWVDIGQLSDYERVQEYARSQRPTP